MNKLEINIDSTALGSSSCMLNLYRTVIGSIGQDGLSEGGYRVKVNAPALTYGVAVHKFLDVMFKTKGQFPKAIKAAIEMFNLPTAEDGKKKWLRDETHLRSTCYNVWTEHIETESSFDILELNGQPASEITFRIKYYEDDFIIVYLCGTIDNIGKFKNGCYAIRDFKTTSSWDNEGYFKQYEMSRQLIIYPLALKLMAIHEPDSTLGKIGQTQIGAFIDGIFLSADKNKTSFGRSDVYQCSQKKMDEFEVMLQDKLKQLSQAIQQSYYPKEGLLNGTCEQKFSKCKFWDCCRHDDQVGEALLKRQFNQIPFNPLKYNEV